MANADDAVAKNLNESPERSMIQFPIRRIEQFLNNLIQFIDFIELIDSIRHLRIKAICDQFTINLLAGLPLFYV